MERKMLQAGFARVDITPGEPVPLTGYGNDEQRISQGVLDPLYATCIAFTDADGETALVYTVDQLLVSYVLIDDMKQAVSRAAGVPRDRILFAATHTHASPALYLACDSAVRYREFYYSRLAAAAVQALADRAPASLQLARTRTRGMNFVRHYRIADGTVAGDNFGSYAAGAVGHVAPADEEALLARFVRAEAGKKDILLVNWQTHPKLSSTLSTAYGRAHRSFVSSDFVGSCRAYLERRTGCLVAYFSGASGNLNPLSEIKSENPPSLEPGPYGERLGGMLLEGLAGFAPAEAASVRSRRVVFEAQLDHSDDGLVRQARKVMDVWEATNDPKIARAAGEPCGIIGGYHAAAILRRASAGQRRSMELNALSVGDLAFAAAPYEMFCGNGQFIKTHSPFAMTFVLSCCNGYHNYIADDQSCTYNSYEAYGRSFVRGMAEQLARTLTDMLVQVKDPRDQ